MKLPKNWANAKQHLEAELSLLENYSLSSSTLPFKTIGRTLENKQKNIHVCIHQIIKVFVMKMKMKTRYRSDTCNRNRPRSRHGHKYSKYKCLSVMIRFFWGAALCGIIWQLLNQICLRLLWLIETKKQIKQNIYKLFKTVSILASNNSFNLQFV